jgi:hypothetical protein
MSLPTLKLSFVEWTNLVMSVVASLGEDAVKGVIRRAIGPERADKLIEDKKGPALSKDDNRAIIRELYAVVPGATRDDKIAWAIEIGRKAFDTDERFADVLAYVRDRVAADEAAGGTIDNPPPKPPEPPAPPPPPGPGTPPNPATPEKYKSGFLWKPIGDGGRPLVVLLPSAFTGHTGKKITMTDGSGANQVSKLSGFHNGNREPYRFGRKGADYPGPAMVSVAASGKIWSWVVPSTGARNDGKITPTVK